MTRAEKIMSKIKELGREGYIQGIVNKVYGDTTNYKIIVSFEGEIGTLQVVLRNRRQVLSTLKKFRNDKFGVMDWVRKVTIINNYKGHVKVNGVWRIRQQVYVFNIRRKDNGGDNNNGDNRQEELKLTTEDKKNKVIEMNGVKIEVIKKSKKELKKERKEKLDKWIEGDGKLEGLKWNWYKMEVVNKEGITIKRFRSRMNMLSYLMNGGEVVKNEFSKQKQKGQEAPAAAAPAELQEQQEKQQQETEQGPYPLEEIEGLDGIKANWTDLVLADDNFQVKKFKTKGAMKGYITRLKKQRQQEQQQMQLQIG